LDCNRKRQKPTYICGFFLIFCEVISPKKNRAKKLRFIRRSPSRTDTRITVPAAGTTSNGITIVKAAILGISVALLGSCTTSPNIPATTIKPMPISELRENLIRKKSGLDQYELRGPFATTAREDIKIRLSRTEIIDADLFLSANTEKAPLVIFVHGHDSFKKNHAYQAMHLASWGMHSLTIQLPNRGPWIRNGRTLAKLVQFVSRTPSALDKRITMPRIILVGHSFGGTAVSVALAEGAPAIGGVLLDPATISRELPALLRKINKPVMVLGADERVFAARNRHYFYNYIRAGIVEVSIKDASHEDAQFPSQVAFPAENLQIAFVGAITSTAISLYSTGRLDHAWTSFGDAVKNGTFISARKK